MPDVIKVDARIPANREQELLRLAAQWLEEAGHKFPGWDAKAIHRVAKEKYGGLEEMFQHHGWPERGGEIMQRVQARVRDAYGSVEAFVEAHRY
jgi:hypothetical protein